jgi:hypothetical protein
MPRRELHALLCESFSAEELRRFVALDSELHCLADDFSLNGSTAQVAHELIEGAERRGLIGHLFRVLSRERPGKIPEVHAIREGYGAATEDSGASVSGRWFSLRLKLGRLKIAIMLLFAGVTIGFARMAFELTSEPEPEMVRQIVVVESDPSDSMTPLNYTIPWEGRAAPFEEVKPKSLDRCVERGGRPGCSLKRKTPRLPPPDEMRDQALQNPLKDCFKGPCSSRPPP